MKKLRLIAIAAGALLLSACAAQPEGSESSAPQELTDMTVVFAGSFTAPPSQVWIGDKLGFFEEEGVNVTFESADGNVAATQLVASGAADAYAGGIEGVASLINKGTDPGLRTVYNYLRIPIYGWAVQPDSDIEEISDAGGRKIGVASMGSGTLVFAKSTLESAGIDPATVEIFPVGTGAEAATALTNGEVDALVLWDSAFAQIEVSGTELRQLPQAAIQEQGCPCAGIHVSTQFVEENRDAVEGFLRAIAKATVIRLEDPSLALQLHYEMFPATRPTGMDEAQIEAEGLALMDSQADNLVLEVGDNPLWGSLSEDEWIRWMDFLGLDTAATPAAYADYWAGDQFTDAINDFDAAQVIADTEAKFK